MATSGTTYEVSLAVYDLSGGLAAQFSEGFLGRRVEGVWHTGIRVYGREFYFGQGIYNDISGATPFGTPTRIDVLGNTSKTRHEFNHFLSSGDMSTRFSTISYHLLDNNCNHFTNVCAQFLLNRGIDSQILNLPAIVKDSPLSSLLMPAIDAMQRAQTQNGQLFQPQPSTSTAPSPIANGDVANHDQRGSVSSQKVGGVYRKEMAKHPVILASGKPAVIESHIRQSFKSAGSLNVDELISVALSDEHSKIAFAALDLLRHRCVSTTPTATASPSSPPISSSQLNSLIQRHILNDDVDGRACDDRATLMCVRLCVNAVSQSDDELLCTVIEKTVNARSWRTFKGGVLLLRNLACRSMEHHEDIRVRLLFFSHEALQKLDDLPDSFDQHSKIPPDDVALVTVPLLQSIAATVDCDGDNSAEWDILSAYGFDLDRFIRRTELQKDAEANRALDVMMQSRP